MTKALHELEPQPDYLLIDALELEGIGIPQEAIIDGDYKIFSIAAASIVAKVTRDTIMEKLSLEYPAYGFSSHKGYGTNHHYQMLVEHGACPIHRRSFEPVKFFQGSENVSCQPVRIWNFVCSRIGEQQINSRIGRRNCQDSSR